MLRRTGNVLLGIALIPFCIGFSWQLGVTVVNITYQPLVPYWFTGGFLLYLGIHFLFKQPILSYVVGHELTHALFAHAFRRVGQGLSRERKGRPGPPHQIELRHHPGALLLSPVHVLCAYRQLACPGGKRARPGTLAGPFRRRRLRVPYRPDRSIFLQTDQNDIAEHGAFFSYPLIFLFNIVLTALLIRLLLAQDMNYLHTSIDGIMKSIRMIMLGITDADKDVIAAVDPSILRQCLITNCNRITARNDTILSTLSS